jgi:hypothetical protein
VARPTTVRLDSSLIAALKAIARRRAYREQRDVSWVDVLSEAARRLVKAENEAASTTARLT